MDDTMLWLIDGARTAHHPQDVVAQLGDRLMELGIPIVHASVFVATLHPDIIGRKFTWRPGREVEIEELKESEDSESGYHDPQLDEVIGHRHPVRVRDGEGGISDFLMQPLEFINGEVHAVSWATKQAGGFTEADLAVLEKIRAPLARIAESYALQRLAANLLNTYVGRATGEKILSGRIRRGDIESMEAVIAFSDLRGFTTLSNELPAEEVIQLLNDYFDCVVTPFEKLGGEILKFMGDAVLAILPVESDPESACRKALQAVESVRESIAESNRHREHPILFGTALNIGEVLYGNIGSTTRLDFTTIGPAVNFTSRLEGIARDLGRRVVTSEAFAKNCPDAVVSLGTFELKGFEKAAEVYGLKE